MMDDDDDVPPPSNDDEVIRLDDRAGDDEWATTNGGDGPEENQNDDAVVVGTVHTKPVHCVAVHPTQKHIVATGSEDDTVVLWDLSTDPEPLSQVLRGHTDTIIAVAFQPIENPTLLASGGMDNMVILWDITASAVTEAARLTDLEDEIHWIRWHSSGQFLAAGCADGRAALWSIRDRTCTMFVCGDAVTVGLWSADEKKLIVGSADCMIRVFAPRSGESIVCPTGRIPPTALCVVPTHPDGVVVGFEDGSIGVVSFSQHKIVNELQDVHSQAIEKIVLHSSLGLMGCVSCDGIVSMWNISNYTLRYLVRQSDDGFTTAMWLGNLFVAGTLGGAVLVWDGRKEYSEEESQCLTGHRAAVLDVVGVTDTAIVSTSDDATIRLFNIA